MKRAIFAMLFLGASLVFAAPKEIKVDLTAQKVYAIENGKVVIEGHISSGRKGMETPTGKYKITQKKVKHRSNLWPKPNGGARMPYMMRLGSTPIAMHLGDLPGRPASHGCIRLERRIAKKIYRWAPLGTRVTVTGNSSLYLKSNAYVSMIPTKEKRKLIGSPRPQIRYSVYEDEVQIKHGLLGDALTF